VAVDPNGAVTGEIKTLQQGDSVVFARTAAAGRCRRANPRQCVLKAIERRPLITGITEGNVVDFDVAGDRGVSPRTPLCSTGRFMTSPSISTDISTPGSCSEGR